MLGAGCLEIRLEDLPDVEPANDVRSAPDVVALGVGEDERGERADAHVFELPRGVALGWALVDENARTGRLEQNRVALTDVEERDSKTRRRLSRRPGTRQPGRAENERRTAQRDCDRRPLRS